MNRYLYLLIEIQKRELDSKILLALEALNNGYKVAISKKSRLFEKLHIIEPGIIFLKSFGIKYNIHLDNIINNGHKITGIDEEGLQVIRKSALVEDRFSNKCLEHLSLLFAWGDYAKKIYNSYALKQKINLKITSCGHPRMDLIKKPLINFYLKKAKRIKKEYGNYILIASQFPRYNSMGQDYNKTSKLRKSISQYKKGSLYNTAYLIQKKNFYEYEKLYLFLKKRFPKKRFLLLPHPAEDLSYYEQFKEKNSNINVINDIESIIPYIMSCETLIAMNCTTSIESFILGKISINHIPAKNAKYEFKLPKLLSLNSKSLKNIENILKKKTYKNKNAISGTNIFEASKILDNLKHKKSTDIIINGLNSIKIEKKKNTRFKFILYLYFFLKTKLKNCIYIIFTRDKFSFKNQISKRAGLTKANIQNKVNLLSSINYPGKKYVVKEDYYGLFYIEKKKY
ncbi:hypothetical protein OAB10_04285 [Candidatus Pelagibacter sp.]|nr:hypothetical protein [Candidatus Pelagibacter sp.]